MTSTVEGIKAEAAGLGSRLGDWMEHLREQGAEFLPDKEQLRQDADRLLSGLAERLEDLPALVAENVPGIPPAKPSAGEVAAGAADRGRGHVPLRPRAGGGRRRRIVEKVRGWFSGGQTPSGPYVEGTSPTPPGSWTPAAEPNRFAGRLVRRPLVRNVLKNCPAP